MQHHVARWTYQRKPLGAGYSGPETYEESTETMTTGDGQVAVGSWRYDGKLSSSNAMNAHQIWVVTAGSARVEMDGVVSTLAAGSAICFEAPYGPKVVTASDDFTAVWIAVPRRPAP
jgi:hypothetical protein